MATNKQAFTLRMQPINVLKMKFIAERNKRSLSRQIEYLIEIFIHDYERANGVINLDDNNDDNEDNYSQSSTSVIQNNHGGTNLLAAGSNNNFFAFG